MNPSPDQRTNSQRPSTDRLRRVSSIVAAAALGGITGLTVLLMIVAFQRRNALPTLEPERFYEAKTQWESAAPANYNIEVAVSGRQAAVYYVEVRDGTVNTALRNGDPLRQQRTLGTWSVPGMFGTMESDVKNLIRHREGTADHSTPQVLLRAEFHDRFGFPVSYLRTELARWSNNRVVSWETTLFEVIE